MAKPLRIGGMINVEQPFPGVVEELRRFADALTMLAAAGVEVPGIGLGTGVVPIHPRHPMALAAQALTVQAVTGNRLILGIGLSHQVMVEGIWGLSYEKPARYMKEYLAALMPLLRGETVSSTGERVTANAPLPLSIPGASAPPVLVAALGTVMLKLAGTVADGTVTWMTGTGTIGDHIVPTITAAAEAAGRPAPRVGVALPVTVTGDIDTAKERINQEMAIYPSLPSYKAMLDKEGAERAADIGFVGDEESVLASVARLADAGATDFVAYIIGNEAERERTFALMSELARS
jgi:F420-dependent oxidoreductase-like protein